MEASKADDERTAWLQSNGYRVIRFWNDQVLNETGAVLEEILRFLNQENQRWKYLPLIPAFSLRGRGGIKPKKAFCEDNGFAVCQTGPFSLVSLFQ